jgi:polyhydroxybutyrate depolymerase
MPLVLDLHGYGTTKRFQSGWFGSGFRAKADTLGFVYVTPQGLLNSWNAQGRCCWFQPNPPDDVAFLEAVVAAVRAAGSIDPKRIYVTGFSNGGSMALTLACRRSELFAGVASVSFSLSGGATPEEIVAACAPARPIPVIHFHGTSDLISPYADGALDSIGARQSLDLWAEIQQCDRADPPEPVAKGTVCETRPNCRGGVAVRLCTVENGHHRLYRYVADPDIPEQIWEFWQRFPR